MWSRLCELDPLGYPLGLLAISHARFACFAYVPRTQAGTRALSLMLEVGRNSNPVNICSFATLADQSNHPSRLCPLVAFHAHFLVLYPRRKGLPHVTVGQFLFSTYKATQYQVFHTPLFHGLSAFGTVYIQVGDKQVIQSLLIKST